MSADDFLASKPTLPGIAELLDAHTYTADLHSANRNNGSGTLDWRLEYSFKGKFGLPDMSEPAKTCPSLSPLFLLLSFLRGRRERADAGLVRRCQARNHLKHWPRK